MMRIVRGGAGFVAGLMVLLISGCAATVEGAKAPPRAWVADSFSARCEALSGTYAAEGEPAPENAHSWLYNVVWPREGSLVSFIEQGANAPSRSTVWSVRIAVDSVGRATFEARNAEGAQQPLAPREWWCEGGALVTRTALGSASAAASNGNHNESYVRLWKRGGALIAEQSIRAVKPHALRSSARYRSLARFYFRFSPQA